MYTVFVPQQGIRSRLKRAREFNQHINIKLKRFPGTLCDALATKCDFVSGIRHGIQLADDC